MPWVDTPPGVKQPVTGTWLRAVRRRRSNFDYNWRQSEIEERKALRGQKNEELRNQAKKIGEKNRQATAINTFNRMVNRFNGTTRGKQQKLQGMPALRYLSRSEINRVRAKAGTAHASTGRNGH